MHSDGRNRLLLKGRGDCPAEGHPAVVSRRPRGGEKHQAANADAPAAAGPVHHGQPVSARDGRPGCLTPTVRALAQAAYDVERLLADPGVVRNRLKVEAAVRNAGAFLAVRQEFGTFDRYIWRFVGRETRQNAWKSSKE